MQEPTYNIEEYPPGLINLVLRLLISFLPHLSSRKVQPFTGRLYSTDEN